MNLFSLSSVTFSHNAMKDLCEQTTECDGFWLMDITQFGPIFVVRLTVENSVQYKVQYNIKAKSYQASPYLGFMAYL